jgi:hypothetical protein
MSTSPIRDSAGKLAITPGVWRLSKTGLHLDAPSFKSAGYCGGACVNSAMRYESSRLADAALIAEAGTVTNQTGRTPAELAAMVRELREALKNVNHEGGCYCDAQYAMGGAYPRHAADCEAARAAIAKSEGI